MIVCVCVCVCVCVQVSIRDVVVSDVLTALKTSCPSVSTDDILRYEMFSDRNTL